MVKTEKELNKILHDYVELARKSFFIKEAYLFGSYVSNSAHNDSDIDIALVSPDFENIPEDALLKILFKMARHIDTAIEPIALTEEEIRMPTIGTVAVDIKNKGRIIYQLKS